MTISREGIAAVSGRTVSGRGLVYMKPVKAESGDAVCVFESSAADAPYIWLQVTGAGLAHLTLDQARVVERQLRWLRKHHYQVSDA